MVQLLLAQIIKKIPYPAMVVITTKRRKDTTGVVHENIDIDSRCNANCYLVAELSCKKSISWSLSGNTQQIKDLATN